MGAQEWMRWGRSGHRALALAHPAYHGPTQEPGPWDKSTSWPRIPNPWGKPQWLQAPEPTQVRKQFRAQEGQQSFVG